MKNFHIKITHIYGLYSDAQLCINSGIMKPVKLNAQFLKNNFFLFI